MPNRVYDPIHDVFSVQTPSGSSSSATDSAPVVEPATNANADPNSTINEDVPEMQEQDYQDDDDGESTQSEDNQEPVTYDSVKKKLKEPSKYTRHLKKPDGHCFTRKDIQFQFLCDLFSDEKQLFTNTFKHTFSITPTATDEVCNVTSAHYNARKFIANDKLTFSQLYLLTIASSTKSSKILRDKLLFDQNVALSTCILSLLVNMGRLNTTINFFLEMTSQLRTFHSIPCLQHNVRDPKSLQDTPRLKSILKNLPDGNEPFNLTEFYEHAEKRLQVNPVNLLFTLCDNVTLVNLKFVSQYTEKNATFFDIFDSWNFEPQQRAQLFLWVIYIHLQTDLTPESVQESLKLFGVKDKFPLDPPSQDYDVDTPSELEFGKQQHEKRLEFLKKHNRLPVERREELAPSRREGQLSELEKRIMKKRKSRKKSTSKANDTVTTPAKSSPSSTASSPSLSGTNGFPSPSDPQPQVSEFTPSKQSSKKRKLEQEEKPVDPQKLQEIETLCHEDHAHKIRTNLTQQKLLTNLQKSQEASKSKRKELGLIKLFNEYEDVTMATVIGVRGKKRKKFKDGVLGFETDYLKTLSAAKQRMLIEDTEQEMGETEYFE